jgi:hypothetical protein
MNSDMAFAGSLAARVTHAPKIGLGWKLRNLRNVLPGLAQDAIARALGMNHLQTRLYARKTFADGRVLDYGLIGTHMVTTAFCAYMVDQLQTETSTWGDFKYHDSGTGVGDEAVGDTSMGTFSTEMVGDIRGVGTQTEGTSVQYRSVATITYDGTGGAITEHGLFNDTRANGGTLMDRTKFAAINVVATDTITFTYTLTATAGG